MSSFSNLPKLRILLQNKLHSLDVLVEIWSISKLGKEKNLFQSNLLTRFNPSLTLDKRSNRSVGNDSCNLSFLTSDVSFPSNLIELIVPELKISKIIDIRPGTLSLDITIWKDLKPCFIVSQYTKVMNRMVFDHLPKVLDMIETQDKFVNNLCQVNS